MTSTRATQRSGFHVLTIQRFSDSTLSALVCLLLAAVTLLCYWPVLFHEFVSLDDTHYLFDSGYVSKGLTWSGAVWALQTGYFSNWHPLTWLSYMVDAQIYGMGPMGFHLTNLLFHIADSLLVFLLLKSMTQRLWLSAFVAALFAWHPLHVESVAWVSERKDVLSTFFFLLTLIAYFRYVKAREISCPLRNRVSAYYLLSLLFFMLALASKQMVVTLPCVLLLLDFWPLRRISFEASKRGDLISARLILLREKLPFFALAFAASAVAFAVQKASGSLSSVEALPIRYRIANALFAYVSYLFGTFWPANLAAIYPLSPHFSIFGLSAAALFLGAVTALVVFRARQNPFLSVGWFWFVGTLVPVIGLIQVGSQSHADRYMYIPSIGLFIALIWGLDALCCSWVGRSSRRRKEAEGTGLGLPLPPDVGGYALSGPSAEYEMSGPVVEPGKFVTVERFAGTLASPVTPYGGAIIFRVLAVLSIVVLAGCLFCTRVQVGYWHDSEKLFSHSIAAVPNNYIGYDCLGKAHDDRGRKEEAVRAWNEAIRLAPAFAEAQYNLGTSLLEQGKLAEALPHLKAAVKLEPNNANARENLGNVYLKTDKLPEATSEYAAAAALAPDNAVFLHVLGSVLVRQSKWSEAATVLADVLKLDPKNADANRNFGVVLVNQGRRPEAIRYFSEAVRLRPDDSGIRFNLGLALLEENQPRRAAEQFVECLRLDPDETRSHYRLAIALSQLHKVKDAIFHYREALRLTPEFPEAMNELAHLLACAPEADLRDGIEAVKLAEKACAMMNNQQPNMLTTLAAAYAEAGRFQEAIGAAQKAHDLATNNGQVALAAKAGELLELCQSRRPLRE